MAVTTFHWPAGSTTRSAYELDITPKVAGWEFTGLAVLTLAAGETATVETTGTEMLVLPLNGGCEVTVGGQSLQLTGRPAVFSGPTDFAYLPRDCSASVTSRDGGRFALPSAVCDRRLPFRYAARADVSIELRGAGQASRQVNNLCTSDSFDADNLIVCEVVTPGGNWSSYPPHKHDEASDDESVLEEIYYFEVAAGPGGPGMGYQRVYGHAGADIDVLAEVRTGDVVVIPHGWHGPSMAAPGYDLYYLNVMAGPDPVREWKIRDDPAHAWVRDRWGEEAVDSRLPFGTDDAQWHRADRLTKPAAIGEGESS
jgi:5-deoxy-glucuronate isomerase